MDFDGKVVVITGATSLIGSAAAVRFAQLGASLCLCGKTEETLNRVAKRCEPFCKTEPLIIAGNLHDEKDVLLIVHTTIKYFLTIDVLVNNASILELDSIEKCDLMCFDRIFNLNVRAMYHLTSLAIPYLIMAQGAIVNVSSVNGIRSFPGVLAYNMSKSAVDQFTKCTALELASKKVRVNSVNHGAISIERKTSVSLLDENQYQKFLDSLQTTQALDRRGTCAEIADAIAFLASEKAGFITGVNMPVDGGLHLMCPM